MQLMDWLEAWPKPPRLPSRGVAERPPVAIISLNGQLITGAKLQAYIKTLGPNLGDKFSVPSFTSRDIVVENRAVAAALQLPILCPLGSAAYID